MWPPASVGTQVNDFSLRLTRNSGATQTDLMHVEDEVMDRFEERHLSQMARMEPWRAPQSP